MRKVIATYIYHCYVVTFLRIYNAPTSPPGQPALAKAPPLDIGQRPLVTTPSRRHLTRGDTHPQYTLLSLS